MTGTAGQGGAAARPAGEPASGTAAANPAPNLGRRDQRDVPWVTGVARVLMGLMAVVPHFTLKPLAAVIAYFVWRLHGPTRRVIETNLTLALPHLEASERRTLGRASLTHTALGFLELGPLWYRAPARALDRIARVTGGARLEAALASGRGVLILAPHLGSWELLNMYVATLGPLTALYLPPRIAGVEDLMLRGRSRTGTRIVPTSAQGLRALFAALRAGEAVGILPDQVPGRRGGLHVPFFGQPALTMTLVHRLLRKHRPVVFVAGALRLSGSGLSELVFLPVDAAIHAEDPAISLRAMNAAVERLVMQAPEQYQWAYQRFKNPPAGMPSPYES